MAIKGQSFGNLDDKRELQDKAPAPEGYHHSLLPHSPKIIYAFALWENAELYILIPSMTDSLTYLLTYSSKNLKISLNLYARAL